MSSYFSQSNKRGELKELEDELNSNDKNRKKEAVKKIIAAMTVGKDVSSLFPHVTKCMITSNIELKKLVYLYIINYAKSQPDLAMMAVNAFRRDASERSNPLIRALAVRTMGCIRVEKIIEYLCEPLKDALSDEDPYVRKTAAICVAKLYDINAELVEDHEFLQLLQRLLSDGNSMVVSNAIAGLTEISESRGENVLPLDSSTMGKILTALNECTEWGQVFILDALANYTPADPKEAESIIERVIPRLSHANAAVVLSTIKVMMKYMDLITNAETIRGLCRKMAPSLVTLLNNEPEIQYVALKNINLIVQKRANILEKEVRVFFCKYNDPIYVKLEKLEIMIKLADNKNIDQVLHEFKEYANEVDVDFVRRSVRAIGRCAIKLEKAAERCVQALLELIGTGVNHVIQEAIIVIKDIFRKYPNKYESILKKLCDNLKILDEPEAKSSMIWIIGEYADLIENADDLLNHFLEGFNDEPPLVQLQLLTAIVKLYLQKPDDTEDMITEVLKLSTEESENPDLRDRGYIYWRLLSTEPDLTKQVVLSEKPTIHDDSYTLDSILLDKLIENIGTLSSVYHKAPETFVSKIRENMNAREKAEEEAEEYAQEEEEDSSGKRRSDYEDGQKAGDLIPLDDLLQVGGGDSDDEQESGNRGGADAGLDLLDFGGAPASNFVKIPLQTVLQPTQAGSKAKATGVQVDAAFQRENGQIVLEMKLSNHTQGMVNDFALQFNTNSFGLTHGAAMESVSLSAGESRSVKVPMKVSPDRSNKQPPATPFFVQIALKTSIDVFYFQTACILGVLLVEDGKMSKDEFKNAWQNYASNPDSVHATKNTSHLSTQDIINKFENANVFMIAERQNQQNQKMIYFSCKTVNNIELVIEVSQPSGQDPSGTSLTVRSKAASLTNMFFQLATFLLSN
eukprot:CAMPEP_0115019144 /NCGR_PEP_ID=MMETSP0216-20121206/29252_1 /TAXON_ID=223996 /ORGANISM="Protocruzia adherens, Strain Boccale" /LENGTH=911 /DNA_ID=CAMNT_0002390525 /DNA_START=118 /DNA_END=2853 /DNA_ORIENTATION=-